MEAFRDLVESYQKLLFSICFNLTHDYFEAENITQDTFVVFYQQYYGKAHTNVKSLLCTIAANRCRDYLKSSRVRTTATAPPEDFSAVQAAQTVEQAVEERQADAALRQLCQSLDEPYRTVSLAYYVEGLTALEIAARTGGNLNTVKTQLRRARARMQSKWKEAYGNERA